MRRIVPVLKLSTALLAATALSGCFLSSGGGAGGGVAGNFGQFDTAYANAETRMLTTDMPVSGSASYVGSAAMTLSQGGVEGGRVLSDLALEVLFGPDQSGTIDGTASNFRGTVQGEEVAFEGSLSSANAAGLPNMTQVTETTVDAPVVGPVTTRTGVLFVNMRGELTADGDTETVLMTLGGAFTGEGATGAFGPASIQVENPLEPDPIVGAGTYYVNRQ